MYAIRSYYAEDVPEVDLARGRFVAARVVAHLEVADLVPRRIDVGDQVPFRNLLVIEVVEDLAGRTVYRPANLPGLRDALEEQSGMVAGVERLEDHHQSMGFQDRRRTLERLDHIRGLVVVMKPRNNFV